MKISNTYVLIIIGLVLLNQFNTSAQAPVAYWPFTGNANDSTANGNDGIITGAVLSNDRYAMPNRCYSFNGIDQYITGSNAGINLPTADSPRTITAWIRSNDATHPNYDRVVFHYGTDQSAPTNYHLGVTRNGRGFIGNGYGYGAIIGGQSVDDTTWHFLVGVYEGPATNMLRLYVDGILDTFALASSAPNTTLGPIGE